MTTDPTTPIPNCEFKNSEDGCCSHPKNATPECHKHACPRIAQLAGWQPIDTAPRTEKEILLKTSVGIVSAWFDHEEHQWVCYDDAFTIDPDGSSATHWMSLDDATIIAALADTQRELKEAQAKIAGMTQSRDNWAELHRIESGYHSEFANRAEALEQQLAARTAELRAAEERVKALRDVLIECFAHLGKEIGSKNLNVSAWDGTQVLSRKVAEVLDRTALRAQPPAGDGTGKPPSP